MGSFKKKSSFLSFNKMLQLHSRSHSPRASACSVSSYSSLLVVLSRVVAFRRRYFLKLLRTFHSLVAKSLPSLCRCEVSRSREMKLVWCYCEPGSASCLPKFFCSPSHSAEANSFTTDFPDWNTLEKQIQEHVPPQLAFPKFSG